MAADVVFEVEDKLLLCRWEDMSWPLASTVLHVELALDVRIVSAVYGGGGSTRKKKNCSHKITREQQGETLPPKSLCPHLKTEALIKHKVIMVQSSVICSVFPTKQQSNQSNKPLA